MKFISCEWIVNECEFVFLCKRNSKSIQVLPTHRSGAWLYHFINFQNETETRKKETFSHSVKSRIFYYLNGCHAYDTDYVRIRIWLSAFGSIRNKKNDPKHFPFSLLHYFDEIPVFVARQKWFDTVKKLHFFRSTSEKIFVEFILVSSLLLLLCHLTSNSVHSYFFGRHSCVQWI